MKTTIEYPTYVECPKCGSKYSEDEVKIVDITLSCSRPFSLTFVCPRCDEEVQSLRYE